MDKDNNNSTFDFDKDPEFNENFYKNIEKVLGDFNETADETANGINGNVEVKEQTDISEEKEMDEADKEKNEVKMSDEQDSSGEESAAATQPEEEITAGVIDDELVDINASLAQQICDEMETMKEENAKQKDKRWYKIQSGVMIMILCLIGFGFFLGFTKPGNQLLMGMGVNLGGTIWATWTGNFEDNTDVVEDIDYIDDEDIASEGEEIDPNTIKWPDHPGEGRKEDGVYNILVLGEEAIGNGSSRGRTDVIVIATMNTKNKTLRLTSLMRDTLVRIPGYNDNRLNSAYEKGGLDLLYETISLNFDLSLDGCVMVNFEKFEEIIDKLGGLEITLTAGEASYLNSTNYISNPANRNVSEGKQLLNGNQVLGYSRVRKRATITGNNNDFGRTDRHRIVLNAIFDKYKTTSKTDLAAMMFELLPMITTDIDNKCFELLLNSFIDMGTTQMEQLRIPADGAFDANKKVRGMSVLIPDLDQNVEILHNFVFGENSVQNSTSANSITGAPNQNVGN